MKVLAVSAGHAIPRRSPVGKTWSGQSKAAWELSVATAELVDLELAIMSDHDEVLTADSLKVRYVTCFNHLDPVKRIVPRISFNQFFDSRIPELIRGGDFDLVHIHGVLPPLAVLRVAQACQRKKIPYVISSHGFNEVARYAKVHNFGAVKTALAALAIDFPFRRIVKGATAIFALSDRESDVLLQLDVTADRIHVVTNGVSEFYLEPAPDAELSKARESFSIDEDKPTLLYIGAVEGYKGLDVFIRSLHQIKQPYQAIVVGKLKSESEGVEQLRKAGFAGDDSPDVTFTGPVTEEELRALLNLADLFVYPTLADTLPLVVLEAMAAGLPIVSSDLSGIPFMVSPEEGILVPPGDDVAVGQAVATLLSDPSRRRQMGASARLKVLRDFRWSVAAKNAVAAYEAILKSQ
jgi:glycosyltransferase involved in cell wall biosynthesis